MSIYNNSILVSLVGLENLTSFEGGLAIGGNSSLTSLAGLENITSVKGDLRIVNNNVLISLAGLENITSVGYLYVYDNDVLSCFCNLYELINGGGLTGYYNVYNNAVNPTQQEIIDGGPCISIIGGEVITLLNSIGDGLAGGTVKYYAGGWYDVEGETGANGEIVVDLPENVTPTSWKMYYAGASLQQNKPASPIVFQTVNVTMGLESSTGEELNSDNAQYYASGWKTFGTGITGTSMELLPNNYPFKVYYQGGSNQKSQDVGVDADVVFQTANVSMELASSAGEQLTSDNAQYYAGGWKTFGTGITGTSMELLPNNYPFKVYYQGGSNQKSQDVYTDADVAFQTVNVSMELASSAGEQLTSDNAQYYASGWKTFGSGITGTSMELLPNNYPFKVYYQGGSNQKSQNVGTDANVVFTTGLVTMNLYSSSGATLMSDNAQYYASGWKTFGTGITGTSMELLPNNYPFKVYYAGGSNQKSQIVENGSIVDFSTTEVTMTLEINGSPAASTNAQYYAGGWKTFGTGITETTMELLSNNYPFKVYYDGISEQKSQDVGLNPFVAFTAGKKAAAITEDEKNAFSNDEISVYPNPFTESLKFEFVSPVNAHANIDIFDVTGRKVKTVFNGSVEGNVPYTFEFVPASEESNLYFYQIRLGEEVIYGKVVYTKR